MATRGEHRAESSEGGEESAHDAAIRSVAQDWCVHRKPEVDERAFRELAFLPEEELFPGCASPRRAFLEAVLSHNDMEFVPGEDASRRKITPESVKAALERGDELETFRFDMRHVLHNNPFTSASLYCTTYPASGWEFLRKFWARLYHCLNQDDGIVPFSWDHLTTPGCSLCPVLDLQDPCTVVRVLHTLPWVAFRPDHRNPNDKKHWESLRSLAMCRMWQGSSQEQFLFYGYFLVGLEKKAPSPRIQEWAAEELQRVKGEIAAVCYPLALLDREDLVDPLVKRLHDQVVAEGTP